MPKLTLQGSFWYAAGQEIYRHVLHKGKEREVAKWLGHPVNQYLGRCLDLLLLADNSFFSRLSRYLQRTDAPNEIGFAALRREAMAYPR